MAFLIYLEITNLLLSNNLVILSTEKGTSRVLSTNNSTSPIKKQVPLTKNNISQSNNPVKSGIPL